MRDRKEEKSRKESQEGSGAEPRERPQEGAAEAPQAGWEGPEPGRADAPGEPGDADRLRELTQELDALRDRYLRTVAEFENFRRRTERERAEAGGRAQAQVAERLLEALDDLERVTHYGVDSTTVEGLLEGVQMVERKLLRSLEGAGLEKVAPRGQPFDPTVHEALMTAPAASAEEDETVGEVFQPGYLFQGILLRPARVQVLKFGE